MSPRARFTDSRHLAYIALAALIMTTAPLAASSSVLAGASSAEKVLLAITRQEVVANGHQFGEVGPYERLLGTIHVQLDPSDPRNAVIVDLDKAPRNAEGLVEYDADVALLRPVKMDHWNGKLVFEVNNRGNKRLFNYLGGSGVSIADLNAASSLASFGNGFLLNEGYAIAWAGWEADVLPGSNRMTIRVPVPTEADGRPVTQRIAVEFHDRNFKSDGTTTSLPLSGSPDFASYPAVLADEASAELRVRQSDSPRPPASDIPIGSLVPRDQWSFATSTQISLPSGFKPGFVYELSYTAQDPRIMALGYAVTRDTVSFLRNRTTDNRGSPNPLAANGGVKHALGFGVSSSGMYLRDFLYQGFNEDLAGQRVLDGIHIHIPGAQKLFLNYRFAQPNPFATEHRDRYMPYVSFPFNFGVRENPLVADGTVTGPLRDGILKRPPTDPLVIQTDSSTEYRQFQASLVDTDGFGHDVRLPESARHYLISGTQHAVTPGAPPIRGLCQQLSNPTHGGPALRALFIDLDEWVSNGVPPPPNRRPTVDGGGLVSPDQESVDFPDIPGVTFNGLFNAGGERDFGPRASQNRGIIDNWGHPPVLNEYTILVPKVNRIGIDLSGDEVPQVGVPTATLTGWNLRRAPFAASDLCGLTGMFLPLPKTEDQAEAAGDPRPALQELYQTHEGYVQAVVDFTEEMEQARLLLHEDAVQAVIDAENSDILRG